MKALVTLATVALFALPAAGFAAENLTAQQERMKGCNAEAKTKQLKGEERQQFMSACLKGDDDQKLSAQQEKMKTCNAQASGKGLKGDERRSFMSQCLSAGGKGAAAAGSTRK